MSETTDNGQVNAQDAANQELQHHLAMAFGEPLPASTTQQPTQSAEATSQEPAQEPTPVAANPDVQEFDEVDYLKNNFGWDNRDAALAELQELRRLKESPQATAAEIKYANEESKKWHTYLKEGKEEELYQALHAKQQVKNLDALNDEQKIKLYIKLNNPLFDEELIDYKYKQDYSFDESKYKDEIDGSITDPMGYRFAKMNVQQKMQNDLSVANQYFSQYKTKIELPDIQPTQQSTDEEYEQYKASNAKSAEDYNKMIVPAVNALKEADLQLKINVDDPNNQMNFEVAISPDTNDFNSVKADSLNFLDWVTKTFYDDKGNFLASKLSRAILLERNFDKYAQSIARQAVNAERKRVVAKESVGGRVIERNFNVNPEQQTELTKQMDRAFAV